MKSHYLALGTLALLAAIPARPAVPPPQSAAAAQSPASDTPALRAFGGRSAKQRLSASGEKLDAALADLTNHVNLASPQTALSDLHSLSPAARFMQRPSDPTPLVLIDAVTRGDPQRLKNVLVALGLQNPSVFSNDVSGWLPVTQINAASARVEIHSMRAAMSRARSGAVTSQGDFAQHSDVLRTTYPTLTGSGITVGAISDSYNCYPVYAQNGVPASGPAGYASNGFLATATSDVTSGDLPSAVTVVQEATCLSYGAPTQLPFGDEGRAMLQIVHDVAPGAGLAFYTAENGEAAFANGILALKNAHAQVITDDVGYFDEPFFQDGMVAQAIDQVVAQGVAYFSAAGNDGSDAYDNLTPNFSTLSHTAPTANEYLLNFDNSGTTTTTSLAVTVPALDQGELVALVLQWDQPYVTGAAGSPGASSHLDLCVSGAGNDKIINLNGTAVTCTGPNATGADPVQILIVSNPANAAAPTAPETINITIGLADGTTGPGHVKLAVEGGGAGVKFNPALAQYTKNPTLQGHPNAQGAAAVGAAAFYNTPTCGVSPAMLERYSAQGGSPTLFDKSGNRLATAATRQKPDFVAPDAGNDTFLGFHDTHDNSTVTQCAQNASYPNFLGTSAAAPHAAAIAALMLQANSSLTPAQIYSAMQSTALPMLTGATTPDYLSGYGFIQADMVLAAVPPGAPTLTLDKTSLAPGGTATLTWSSINTTACTASGSWSGTQPTSGTATITAPATAGTATYTLTCNNAQGSNNSSVTLTVAAVSSGGGGVIDPAVLFLLAGLGLARLVFAAQHRLPPRLQKR